MEDKSKLYEKIEFLGEGQVRKLDTYECIILFFSILPKR